MLASDKKPEEQHDKTQAQCYSAGIKFSIEGLNLELQNSILRIGTSLRKSK